MWYHFLRVMGLELDKEYLRNSRTSGSVSMFRDLTRELWIMKEYRVGVGESTAKMRYHDQGTKGRDDVVGMVRYGHADLR